MDFPSENLHNVVRSFFIAIIVGEISENISSAVAIDRETDGEQFVKMIARGESE